MMLFSQHIFVVVLYGLSLHCFLLLSLYTNMVIITVVDEWRHSLTIKLHLHFTCVTFVIVMMYTCRQFTGGKD